MTPLIQTRKEILTGICAASAVTILFFVLMSKTGLYLPPGLTNIALFALFVFIALSILRYAVSEFIRTKEALSFLLMLWIAGTFVFVVFVNWTVSARTILPMLPAVSILIMQTAEGRLNAARRLAVIFAALALSLSIAAADASYANSAREAASRIKEKYASQHVWFDGHWGFQYYMEGYGFRAVDASSSAVINKGICSSSPASGLTLYLALLPLAQALFHILIMFRFNLCDGSQLLI